jgi:hypothetical protein
MEDKWIVRRHEKSARETTFAKNILSNEMFWTAFNFPQSAVFSILQCEEMLKYCLQWEKRGFICAHIVGVL